MFEQFSFFAHCKLQSSDHAITEYCVDQPEMHGTFRVFQAFPGIEYIFIQLTNQHDTFPHQMIHGIIQFNLCLTGRLGWNLKDGQSIYLGAEDLSVHQMDHCPILSITTPVPDTTSVMILMNTKCFYDKLPQPLRNVGFNVPAMQQKLCGDGNVTLLPMAVNRESYAIIPKEWPLSCQHTYIQLKFLELMVLLHANENTCRQPTSYPTALMDTIQAIHQELVKNLHRKITVEDLSRRYFLNTTTIKKAFKYLYGEPINQYVRTYRMHRAIELLAGNDSIREIAWKVGYENQSKFARLFREKMKCSPSEYRQKQKKT